MRIMALMLLVIMHYGCLYTMEERLALYMYGTTEINLKQQLFNIKAVDGKVTFICLGVNEQQLIEKRVSSEFCVGDTHVYHRKSRIIEVVEPLLFKSEYTGEYSYYIERRCLEKKDEFSGTKWFDEQAVVKACDGLAVCYKNLLIAGLKEKLADTQGKSIAIPEIGTCSAFSREEIGLVAVPEILKFIQNYPGAYTHIDLFVKEQSEYSLYKKLLYFYLGNIIQDERIFLEY